jgi:serine phosphatase RsbU (regulator of sigma subunit)
VEAERDGEEFGLEGTEAIPQHAPTSTAREVCQTILRATQHFTREAPTHNDVTALALVRTG